MTNELPDSHNPEHATEPLALKSNEWLGPLPEPRTLSRGDADGPIQLGYTADQMRAYAYEAVVAERELCAKLCEDKGPELLRWWGDGQANAACQECAAAIRGERKP